MKVSEAIDILAQLPGDQELGMRWMNSPNIRNALDEMLHAMSKHDNEMRYVGMCRDRLKAAEEELEKAEAKFLDTQGTMEMAEKKLRDEGFILNASVYED